jgi:DNA-binding transcriptional MerR regulator
VTERTPDHRRQTHNGHGFPNGGALLTIGQLARRTGLSVRTIRFWSDSGVLPPTERTDAGYRVYDGEAVARLELVRTLRELGLGLDAVQQVLARQASLRQVAQAHVAALDAAIRTLRLHRAVLRTVAKRSTTTEEITLMNKLARLSAQERQQIIDEFVDRAFAGIDANAPGAHIAQAMRTMPADLPEDPTPEQVDAWVELAELVQDAGFQQRVRQMGVIGAQGASGEGAPSGPPISPQEVAEHAGAALAAGVAPESAEGKAVLDRLVPADTPPETRTRLAEQLQTFSDRRVERYWQLLAVINGWPPVPSQVPAWEWLIQALRAQG